MVHRIRPFLLVASLLVPGTEASSQDVRGWALSAVRTAGDEFPVAVVPRAAFQLKLAETAYPGVPPRSVLRYSTELALPSPGTYRFGLEVEGADAVLELDDALHLAADHGRKDGPRRTSEGIPLEGRVTLELVVRRHLVSPMRLRVLWRREYDERGGFPFEPIPTPFTSVPADFDLSATHAMSLETRSLVERKGCTNCHPPERAAAAVHPRAAPSLTGIGTRASVEWMRRWLNEPKELRSHANMPELFREVDEFDVESLLHYLAAQTYDTAGLARESGPEVGNWSDPLAIERGRELYHSVGCVACHGPRASLADVLGDDYLEDTIPEADVPVPFGDLEGKWNPAALAAFLMNPGQVFPDDRMPDFGLDAGEAIALASYLAGEFGGAYSRSEPRAERVAHGKEIVSKKSCLNCHTLATGGGDGKRLEPRATPLFELNPANAEGCLCEGDAVTPIYGFDEEERTRLAAFLETVKDVPRVVAPGDELARTIEHVNCRACHSMELDGAGPGGVAPEVELYFQPADERTDLGDEGRLPPDLGDAGWRLTSRWLRAVLKEDRRARPFLAVRMPRYRSSRVHELPELLARAHGIRPDTDVEPPPVTDEWVRTGREMMGRDAFACFSCHVYEDYPPTGSPGLAIEIFAERLRYEWFVPFMSNPQRYRPGSRMPDFATGGVSEFERFLDGDLRRQIDAFWAYFSLGEHLPPPEALASSGGYQLFVGARPLVHRGFLEHAGSRGVAVGLPNGLSYSFDARELRLVDVWRGSFLNASGSWAGRGGNPLAGRGEVLWEAPPGPALVFGEPVPPAEGMPVEGTRFRGYRLDEAGHPSFLYELRGHEVEERVTLTTGADVGMQRELVIRAPEEGVGFHLRLGPGDARVRWRADGGDWREVRGERSEELLEARVEAPGARRVEVRMEGVL